ncbi:Activated CDC42 kinase 1 [Fasciolopsis buskii]|uniref:Activated CDC42 kinase 1 n=1 Tax=Fasciolopsis buskii TaxID=27845 RepID=A0A8E0VIX6_9TREM|nr:Activated CDC42 kinase 1 [Fasciolopsis buski]
MACWRTEPGRRPSFACLTERLDQVRPFKVTAKQNLDESDRFDLEAGDIVIASDGRPQNFRCHGQNRHMDKIGSFSRGIVQRDSKISSEDNSCALAISFVNKKNVGGWSVDRLERAIGGRETPINRRRSLVCATCIPHTGKTRICALTNASSLCDDQDTALMESTPNTYVATLGRLRREQAEGLQTPIPDVDFVASPDFGWTKLTSEDG